LCRARTNAIDSCLKPEKLLEIALLNLDGQVIGINTAIIRN
jgi:hypothetical protein